MRLLFFIGGEARMRIRKIIFLLVSLLVTLDLFAANPFESLRTVEIDNQANRRFPLDNPELDLTNCGMGYYLLAQYEPGNGGLFRNFLGPNLENWNMSNLGLSNSSHFDILFYNVLENDKNVSLFLNN